MLALKSINSLIKLVIDPVSTLTLEEMLGQAKTYAPEFSLAELASNNHYKTSDLFGLKSKLALFFLPGVWAPWSRRLLMDFAQKYELISNRDCDVAFVITQSGYEAKRYGLNLNYKYKILTDPNAGVAKRYASQIESNLPLVPIAKPFGFLLSRDLAINRHFVGLHQQDYMMVPNLINSL